MHRKFQLLVGFILLFLLVLLVQGCSTIGSIQSLLSSRQSAPAPRRHVGPASTPSADYFRIDVRGTAVSEIAGQEAVSTEPMPDGCPGEVGLLKEAEELDASGEEGLSDDVTAEDNAIADFTPAGNGAPAASSEINTAVNRENMMQEIINMLGAHYRFGGTNALGGIDCSAFVGTVYSRAVGMRLPRTSNAQFALGKKIRKDKLLVGDLIFFKTRRRKRAPVSHVGIYVGDNLFAHASRKQGVMISSLDSKYYTKTYVGARRLVLDEISQHLRLAVCHLRK